MLKVFSGTGNQPLTEKVVKLLGIPLSSAEIVRFDNSEIRVRIEESVKNDVCVVIQPTANPTNDNCMELFFFCDALRRQEARKVIGVIPYFGYARQDIQHRQGECISANVMIRFLESIGFYKIYTFDLHDEATEGVFSIPFKNLSALPLLADEVKSYLNMDVVSPDTVRVISPDQGGIERARRFGEHLYGNEHFSIDVIEKKRDQNAIHQAKALNLFGDVKGKTAILVDDIITSGRTLISAAELCISQGATRVLAAVVHHEFSEDSIEKIKASQIEKFFSSDSILLPTDTHFDKFSEISIASTLAEELKTFIPNA